MGRVVKVLIQNQRWSSIINSKSDTLWNYQYKIWQVVISVKQNLTSCKKVNSKPCFLTKPEKSRAYRFCGVKRVESYIFEFTVIFDLWYIFKSLFQSLTHWEIYISKSEALCKFWLKLRQVVKYSPQSLTRRKLFDSKSDSMWIFEFKIWGVVKFFISKSETLQNFEFNIRHAEIF